MTNSYPPVPRFFHRELSWLQFNGRVLDEALDPRLPLSERAKFLAIVSSNLDEFCMVRLPVLLSSRDDTTHDAAGYTGLEQLGLVRKAVAQQVARQYQGYAEIVSAFEDLGVTLLRRHEWTDDERVTLGAYFRDALEPLITPIAIGSDQPFPLAGNLRLYLALELRESEPQGEPSDRLALVMVPATEARLVPLGNGRYAFLEDVVVHSAHHIFPGWKVHTHAAFRVTRDGQLDIDEDHATDLLAEIEEGLWLRGHGAPVRLEVADGAASSVVAWLAEEFELEPEDIIHTQGPVDLTFLFGAAGLSPALARRQYPSHEPAPCPIAFDEPFEALQQQALFLHHPYQSFSPVVEFLEAAARDPRVVAIKQTLYRVSYESPLVQALVSAASAGKQVTVLCELRARFDERRNIGWAKRLEQAGATVLYGVLGYKVHAKLLLIVRREDEGIRRYIHMGTGNYNDKTARLYEDFSYFSAEPEVCRDVANLFNMLTGFSRPPSFQRLLVAPVTFRKRIQELIDAEADRARRGEPARIFAKMNSLVDQEICERLYRASIDGVKIDLVVRGVCILRPGVPGLSENVRVTSVLGRFLEHSRLYYFYSAGRGTYVIGSGDWMTRNLDRRVESLIEVQEPEFRAVLDNVMKDYLDDRRSSRQLQPDGTYLPLAEADDESMGLQERFIAQAEQATTSRRSATPPEALQPARKPSGDVYG